MQVLHQHSLPKTNSNTPHGRKYFLPTKNYTTLHAGQNSTTHLDKNIPHCPWSQEETHCPVPVRTPYRPHTDPMRKNTGYESGRPAVFCSDRRQRFKYEPHGISCGFIFVPVQSLTIILYPFMNPSIQIGVTISSDVE